MSFAETAAQETIPVSPSPRRPRKFLTDAQKMEIGKLAHLHTMTAAEIGAKYNIGHSLVYTCQKFYRLRSGIQSKPETTAVAKADDSPKLLASERQKVATLAQRLAVAEDEIQVLQKLLMTVGRAL